MNMKITLAAAGGALVSALLLADMQTSAAQEPAAPQPAPAATTTNPSPKPERVSPRKEDIELSVDADDALSRLKLLRIQMAIDREEIAALELRIEKLKLQKDFERALQALVSSGAPKAVVNEQKEEIKDRNIMDEILVKAISLSPFKEALVLYRGKVYRLRVGDKLGDSEVADIFEGGLRFKSETGSNRSVGVGQ